MYTVHIFGLERLIEVLKVLEPHLLAKRQLAKLLLEFCISRFKKQRQFIIVERNNHKHPELPPYSERELELIREIRRINKERKGRLL